ncbi:LacI family transcriptional regulator [Humibacillus xanthopallidus]|uniref:LacI family transcriptional regulator n=1 Tax=Humibacillus xanthopallidus TaxID=412689 RepID=A0A543PPE6_9MICO|nr:substrate-binding domain-containing protein [Humibacillus xanthopallidus]TQN45945.1 LacI family transcriptional regulator [Humibacillus xanthopallidus]
MAGPSARTRPRTTLAEVASSAGVSVATVSKVVNGRTDVAPETRERVQDLLDRIGYRPRGAAARRLAVRPAIELAFEGDLHAYSAEIIQGVVDAAAPTGTHVIVTRRPTGAPPVEGPPEDWARDLADSGVRALIAVTSIMSDEQLAALSRAGVHLVVIDPLELPNVDVTSIGSTNFVGGLSAAQHLLDLGHRRIAFLGGHLGAACNQARMSGFRAALERAGIAVPVEYIRSAHFMYADGVAGGAALLDLPVPPTAIFAASDEIAVGVMEAARARGLRVPEDLSVVGFDDTQLARMSSPPLTTVRQPLTEMGRVAVRTALRLIDGESIDSHHVELATELVLRESTDRPTEHPSG